ncbi:MAG: MFS transporter [Candidatus Hodarchaeota archaeon]
MNTKLEFLKSFSRDIQLLAGSLFFRRVVMGSLDVVRTIYFYLIGLSPIAIGILITIGTFGSALQAITFGMLSDKYGRKPFLLLSCLFSISRLILYVSSTDFWVLVLAQSIPEIPPGAGQPMISGYIADKTRVKQRSLIFSGIAIADAAGATLGSLMAGLPAYFQLSLNLDTINAYARLFWIGVVMHALSMIVLLPLTEVRRRNTKPEKATRVSVTSWKEISKFSTIRSTQGLGMGLVTQLLPLYFHLQFGVGSEDLAPIYALARFLAIFTFLLVPFILSRIGSVRCLCITRLMAGSVVAVFALAPSFAIAALLFVTYRLLFQFGLPVRHAFSTRILEPSQTGALIGISNSARQIVQSFAPTIAGYLFEVTSLAIPILSGAALLVFNGIQYPIFYRKKRANNKN